MGGEGRKKQGRGRQGDERKRGEGGDGWESDVGLHAHESKMRGVAPCSRAHVGTASGPRKEQGAFPAAGVCRGLRGERTRARPAPRAGPAWAPRGAFPPSAEASGGSARPAEPAEPANRLDPREPAELLIPQGPSAAACVHPSLGIPLNPARPSRRCSGAPSPPIPLNPPSPRRLGQPIPSGPGWIPVSLRDH